MAKAIRCILGVATVGILVLSTATSHAGVRNESPYSIWVKKEKDSNDPRENQPVLVEPGQSYGGKIDGVAVPSIQKNSVYKTINHCDAIVTVDKILTKCPWWGRDVVQYLIGQWQDEEWVRRNPNWLPLLAKSR